MSDETKRLILARRALHRRRARGGRGTGNDGGEAQPCLTPPNDGG